MNIMEAMQARHSVRSYTDRKITGAVLAELKLEVEACNRESGLNIQLITDEPDAFSGFMAHYGKIKNVQNYIALIGKKDAGLDEKIGYYGERLVLRAQQLGMNTCWVALTYSKGKCRCRINSGEKLVCVLALGYGANEGHPHKSKALTEICHVSGEMPQWFRKGAEAALLAPTAVNQQKFLLTLLDENAVKAEATGGFYSKVDLGIVKYHFELGAEKENFHWA